jgi:hypothetical protein
MIDALVSGVIFQKPAERISATGKKFVVARVRAPTRGDEALLVGVIAFAPPALAALLALEAGDSVALSGELTVKTFVAKDGTTRPSVDLLAHLVTTAYHSNRKRRAVTEPRPVDGKLPFDDDLGAV